MYHDPFSQLDQTPSYDLEGWFTVAQKEERLKLPSLPKVTAEDAKKILRNRKIGIALLCIAVGGLLRAFFPTIQAESRYYLSQVTTQSTLFIRSLFPITNQAAIAAESKNRGQTEAIAYDPLLTPTGDPIKPVNTDFAIIVPKIGINAPVIANVDPNNPEEYDDALSKGVAQASTSYTPDQNGITYLFSHSTNYEWYVKDLNAIFYLLKNLDPGDVIVIIYKNVRYTYQLQDKKIVPSHDITYITPHAGKQGLILQTCWPPGTTLNRLLLFSNLVDVKSL